MSDETVVLNTYFSEVQAQLDRNRLTEAGIESVLDGGSAATMLNYMGSGVAQVRLMVHEEDAERALEVLEAGAIELSSDALEEPELPQGIQPDTSVDKKIIPAIDEDEEIKDDVDPEDPEYLARRAFRAALLGFFLCPPFGHVYSLTLIVLCAQAEKKFTPKARWLLVYAGLLDLLAFGVLGFIFYHWR